jgi:hypothetical protein
MPREKPLTSEESSRQAAFKRALKEKVYNRIPFQVSAFGYFLFRYVLQRGFLDGKEGLIYHVLQGFWYRFLVGAKVEEFSRAIAHLKDSAEIRSVLADVTELDLNTKFDSVDAN